MPAEHDYIGGGGFGHVYKGELGGTAVALKVLYKSNNSVVSPSYRCYDVMVDCRFNSNRPSVERH